MGCISNFTPKKQQDICDVLKLGGTRNSACKRAGVALSTFNDWLHANPNFTESVEVAENEAELAWVARVVKASQTSWQAAAWLLTHRRSKDWSQKAADRIHDAENATDADKTQSLTEAERIANIERLMVAAESRAGIKAPDVAGSGGTGRAAGRRTAQSPVVRPEDTDKD